MPASLVARLGRGLQASFPAVLASFLGLAAPTQRAGLWDADASVTRCAPRSRPTGQLPCGAHFVPWPRGSHAARRFF